MSTVLFTRCTAPHLHHQHPHHDPDRFTLGHIYSTPLDTVSELDYVHELIHSAARREARLWKDPLTRIQTAPIAAPNGPLRTRHTRRQLMATMAIITEANITLHGAPGSPPDLTNSKSSKSSSFHSESLADITGPNDLSHFEDINLDDIHGALPPSSFPNALSPSDRVLYEAPRRPSISSIASSRSTPHASQHSFRDLTGGANTRYPSLKGQISGGVRQQQQSGLSAPSRSSKRRGLTSPSAPSLTNNVSHNGRRSRSPSPNSQVFSSAPRSLSRRSSRTNLDISPMSANPRRQSWQYGGSRKTVKEREAECNDDGDDELPEDAVIWNVPMSPRPAHERSPVPSAPHSPPRHSVSPALSRVPSDRSTASQAHFPPRTSSRKNSAPPSPALSEALEAYQVENEQQQEVERQMPKSPRPVSGEQKQPRGKTQSLPPLRRSDPLIDPLQPSKEKERYLSRTRPSWLPPKDPKEERKHLKELQQIEARRLAAERAEAVKVEEQRIAREKAEIVKTDLWRQYLLPNWDTEIKSKAGRAKNRKVWWQGVPSKMRDEVWLKAIGNDLGVTEATYHKALEKALSDEPHKEADQQALEAEQTFLQKETKKVFPECGLFGPGQVLHEDLVKVWLAYKEYRPDVPIQFLDGVLHISALLLTALSPAHAFTALANLLNRPTPLVFLTDQTSAMGPAFAIVMATLRLKAPSLANHFERTLGLEPGNYLGGLFRGLLCQVLELEMAGRFMDLYVLEGERVVTRGVVAWLLAREGGLYGGREEVIEAIGKRPRAMGSVEEWVGWVVEAGKVPDGTKDGGSS
ncbi:hypothetical protein GQ43DRAFT_371628 [Delitschia confertaspora ATCC 74209]|uniref:Rab-GAP TBC domain-containing protein n=1 Tax=Delitschia confertaspora ATCC 74209 TaxID=1513339 RepID=A0A9P4JQQ4_9PLEO|nr:hypothetical protein GQ43DRAFT_371628 [Delitschia confertaspora ATCC 74209]